MNAPVRIETDPADTTSRSPADLEIVVRDLRFGRGSSPRHWWLNGDPVATAWMNALSATFPRGEAFFIESVKAFREGADPKLAEEIRAFIKQEINHTREHIAFNKLAENSGYDVSFIDQRVKEMLAQLEGRAPILDLASTMALEHFTAMLGHQLLADPKFLEGADGDLGDLWKWHAIEEVEHKGVAYDTWLHATRDWSRGKRWRVKSIMMLVVTKNFFKHRIEDTMALLRQDGLTGWKWRWRLFTYLLVSPGFLRKIIPAWIAYFMPGFHPWNHDDRALIGKQDSEFSDAMMPAE
ncbi:MAG: metal-dependent hydrolase [Sphingomonadaceae bacterium]|nr:metal-dependent hydrolase [Sphingomonadaceae bacterium]